MLEVLLEAKAPLRRLEALGVPVAVGINGPALGGGYEIALACHHRIALDRPQGKDRPARGHAGLDARCRRRGAHGAHAGYAGGADA